MYSLSFVVKEIVFPVIMCGCESCTTEKAWVPKNWCFWNVVLEKTLESPLDCREIKPVNLKGNQHWRFIERTDAEVEASILGSSGAKSCSVQFSSSVMSNSLWPPGLQHARLPCPSPTLIAYSNSSPLSWWCHPTISSSVIPFFPAFNLSQHQGLFKWVHSSHQVAKVLEFQLQHQWIFRTDFL